MSWLKGLKGKRPEVDEGDMATRAEAAAVQPEDGVPDMRAQGDPETLAEAVRRNHNARRPAAAAKEEDDEEIDDGLPSVNRRKTGNKTLTYLGFIAIAIIGGALVWAVNSPKGPPKKKAGDEQLSNAMPQLVLPKPVPPPPPAKPAAVAPPESAKAVAVKPAQTGKPTQEWYDRKMGAPVMAGGLGSGSQGGQGAGATGPGRLNVINGSGDDSLSSKNDLSVKLEATVTKAVSAAMLPNRNFLLTKGTALDCALETAINSTLPGMTTCRLTRDVYSDNGQVIVLDRGTQLVGEYVNGLKNGQARLFVLWTRAKTPNGVVVSLNSPGTDALGRSGHEGFVDNHWMERFGAAILMSVVKDTMAGVIAKQTQQNSAAQTSTTGSVIYSGASTNPYSNTMSGGEQIIARILDATANIPPTLSKNQGDHIQVMVARDLDFSDVYGLKGTE
jgi:type IV secretion system protein VirB10